jgi:hypothetical protein
MRIELTGIAPLIMHNIRLADPDEPITRAVKKLTSKRTNKTDEDRAEIDRLSWVGALYHNAELGPYLPGDNIFRALMEAGSITRSGKKVAQALQVFDLKAPLSYDGPRDVDGLWGDGPTSPYVSRLMVNVEGKRIPRVRPIFPQWSCAFEIDVDDRVLSTEDFQDIATKAGKMIGVGTFRRFYGRFTVEVTQ